MTKTGNRLTRLERVIREHKNVEVPEAVNVTVANISDSKRLHLSIQWVVSTPKLEGYLAHIHLMTYFLEEQIAKVFPDQTFEVRIDSVGIFRTSVHIGMYAVEI